MDPAPVDEMPRPERALISEDWLATIVGLLLVGLVLLGIVTKAMIP
jgi:hypothetical protein